MGMVIYLRRSSSADIARFTADGSAWESFAFEQGDEGVDLIDFDKAWHALHFMLVGAAGTTGDPLGIIAADSEMYGTDEHGFGGFSVVSPGQMTAFNLALRAISDGELERRFDPAAMVREDVYLADVFVDEGQESLEYVMQGVPALRRFAASVAERGEGALRIIA